MSLSITKKGQFYDSNIRETQIKKLHIEPDGSNWELVMHHNNPASNLFSSTDPFDKIVNKNENLYFNFTICRNIVASWEILVIQAAESTSTPIKLRWVQNQSPYGTTFANVAANKITKNTSSGYTNFSHGGLVTGNKATNTYMTVNNGTSGNWWGATGCFKAYQGGIPGFNGVIPTTGYIDIYVRVDTLLNKVSFYKNNIQNCNTFYEY